MKGFCCSFLSGLLIFWSAAVYAADCQGVRSSELGSLQVELVNLKPQVCGVYITPIDKPNLIFRSYLWTSEGLFQVFDSYGNGPEDQMTGTHTFLMVAPSANASVAGVSWQVSSDQSLIEVQTATGEVDSVSVTQGMVMSMSQTAFVDHRPIAPSLAGGFQILHSNFSYFDLGFKKGSAPQLDPDGTAVYYGTSTGSATVDGVGSFACSVKNSDLFNYASDGSVTLKSRSEILSQVQLCLK